MTRAIARVHTHAPHRAHLAMIALLGVVAGGCGQSLEGAEAEVSGVELPSGALGEDASCDASAIEAECLSAGGLAAVCDGEAALCCFDTEAGSALCVDDANAFGPSEAAPRIKLLSGDVRIGGSGDLSFQSCNIPIRFCRWICTEPENEDDIYHCKYVCGCG